mgnify:CR=1 FL=1
MPKVITRDVVLKRFKLVHPKNEFGYDKFVYYGAKIKSLILHKKCGKYFYQSPSEHARGYTHDECSRRARNDAKFYNRDEIIQKFEHVHPENEFDYKLVVYKGMNIKVSIIHTICGTIFNQTPESHISGSGCNNKKCIFDKTSKKRTHTRKRVIKAFEKVHLNNEYDYTLMEYKGNAIPIRIKHNKCGTIFRQRPSDHKQGYGCPKCKQSKGEKILESILEDVCIFYTMQKRYDDCKDIRILPFDAFIPKGQVYEIDGVAKDRLIEWDGDHHDRPVMRHGGLERFITNVKHDHIKNKYCEDNDIVLIRIPWKLFGSRPKPEDVHRYLMDKFETSHEQLKEEIRAKEKEQLETIKKYQVIK